MERSPVTSSNIRSIGYDPASGTLEVEFRSGSVYQYFNVPNQIYRGLITAFSKGAFLNNFIKEQYRYRRVH